MKEFQKLMITVGVFAVMMIGLLFWLYTQYSYIGYQPFDGDPESIRNRIAVLEQQIVGLDAEIAMIPETEKQLAALKKDEAQAKQLLPKENDPAQLLAFINAKAEESEVRPQGITPKKVAAASGGRGRSRAGATAEKFERWQYDMEIIGTYDQIATFINRMEEFEIVLDNGSTERQKRFFAVESLSLEAVSDGMVQGEQEHTARLSMVTYRYTGAPTPPEAGPATAAAAP